MKTRRKWLKPRWRKVLADLWEGKLRTLLVVLSITVGVFAIGAIANSYAVMAEDLDLSYASIHPANIEMTTTAFTDDFLPAVERIPGVAHAEGRQVVKVRTSKDGQEWLSIALFASKDPGEMQINQLQPIAGQASPGKHELVIGYEQMRSTGYYTGDMLQVELPDGTLRQMRVVGEAGDQTRGHDPMGAQRGYITEDTLNWLGQPRNYNRLLVTVDPPGSDMAIIKQVAAAVEDQVEKDGGKVLRTATYTSTEYPMADIALAVLGVLGILGGLVLLLSGSLIVNTLNAIFTQHLRQIGVMKLVGARGGQVLRMYLTMVLIYALIALAIAIPLGAWAGYQLAAMLAGMFNATLQGFRVTPAALAIQALVALCVPLGAAIIPVRNGSKISVRRAISNDRPGDEPAASGFFAWLNRLGAGIFSRPVLLSVRNTFRRKGRLALTLFTLTMAGAIFIGVFNVRVSMEDYMEHLMQHFMADVTLNLAHPYRTTRIAQVVTQTPGVAAIEAWSGSSADILDPQGNVVKSLSIVAPPANTPLLKPEILTGRWIQPGDARSLAISSGIYKVYPNLQPGDSLRLRTADGKTEDWTVAGVFSFNSPFSSLLAYADYGYVADLVGSPAEAASYRVTTTSHNEDNQRAISEAINSRLSAEGFQVSDMEIGAVTREQSGQGVNILIIFLLTMALLTAFVGSIGLTGTMSMNVLERTREIGVMRAIGAGDLSIIKAVLIEGLLIGFISWVCAWLLSYPISYVMLKVISTTMLNEDIALLFTLEGVLLWFGAVMLLSALASVLPARNAARLTIREALAYE